MMRRSPLYNFYNGELNQVITILERLRIRSLRLVDVLTSVFIFLNVGLFITINWHFISDDLDPTVMLIVIVMPIVISIQLWVIDWFLSKGFQSYIPSLILGMVFSVGFTGLIIFGPAFVGNNMIPLIVLLIVNLAISLKIIWMYWFISRKFRETFKQYVVNEFISFIGQDLHYGPKKSIPRAKFSDSHLFQPEISFYQGKDYIHGQLAGVNFEFSELAVTTSSISSKHSKRDYRSSTFNGFFFAIELTKPATGITLIYPRFADQPKSSKMYVRAKLEDPVFEQRFNVYTTDQVGARIQLTPTVMNKIMQFGKIQPHNIHLSFNENHLYVAITGHTNYLEASIWKSLLEQETIWIFLEKLSLILSIPRDFSFVNAVEAN